MSFLDNAYALLVTDLQTGRTHKIADNDYFGHAPFISHNWSPDSQWLAYTKNTNGLIQAVHCTRSHSASLIRSRTDSPR